jgi:hypothetical protein
MQAGAFRWPCRAAGLTVIAAMAVAGCATSPSSAAGGGITSAAQVSPLDAVKLAAKTTEQVNSFTATMEIKVTVKPGAASSTGLGTVDTTATVAEQLRPTLLVSENIGSFNVAGTSISGISAIVTPTTMYIKWSYLTQLLHTAKPWLAIPLSAFSKSTGIDFTQFINQAVANGVLADAQLLNGATSVHRVGTGTINGVPVTEYTGTISISSALPHLTGATKTEVEQLAAAEGLTTETFTIWVDGNNILRKVVKTATGKAATTTTSMTVTSINQPSSITLPPASQTTSLPASALG